MDIKKVLTIVDGVEKSALTESKNMAKDMVMQHYTKPQVNPVTKYRSNVNEYFKVVNNEMLNTIKEEQEAKKVEVKSIVNRVLTRLEESKSEKTAQKPRNFVAKNAKMGGAGAHKDKKKAEKQGDVKHKKKEIAEVSLGNYSHKAKMAQALDKMSMAFGGNQSPEEKARLQQKIDRRERGLDRAKVRTDKKMADYEAKRRAEHEQSIRDKYTGVDIDAEIEKLKPAQQRAYHDYQYGARNTYSDARDEYQRISGKIQELERAKKLLSGLDESVKRISEKSVSKAQQRFMGMVHAAQKGEKAASPEVAKVAKGMSKKAGHDFAATKHKGLPEKKNKVNEATDTVEKDDKGNVKSWKHEGDWEKSKGKEGRGKVTNLSDKARRKTEKMTSKEVTKEGLKDPKDNPCWKGYKPVGTKKKAGKTVPNCVPTNESAYGSLTVGTPVKVYSNVLKKAVFGKVVKLSENRVYVNYNNTKIVMGHPIDSVQINEVAAAAAAPAAGMMGKIGSKLIPGVGLALSGYDAYDRAKKGDYMGAALSGASGLASLIPGIGTAASMGLAGAQLARDYKMKTGTFAPDEAPAGQAATPAAGAPATGGQIKDPVGLQKALIAAGADLGATGADGKIGPKTKAAMADPKFAAIVKKFQTPGQAATPSSGSNVAAAARTVAPAVAAAAKQALPK